MKRSILDLCALIALFAAPLSAQYGTIDAVPSASLLLPYFEVDLLGQEEDEVTTLFAVRNASDTPTILNFTLWTDLGVRTVRFNQCLMGEGVTTVNLLSLFRNFEIPPTCGDSVQFPSCAGSQSGPNLAAGLVSLDSLQRAHTGRPAFDGMCGSTDYDDQVARGYLTVDVVNECADSAPDQPGYFVDGGLGIASNENRIWGDFFIVNALEAFAQGENMVHIQADATLNAPPTFYQRYSGGEDNREPLASRWQTRFSNFEEEKFSRLICWRDSGEVQLPFPCGGVPPPFPLGHGGISLFNVLGQALPQIPPVGSPVVDLAGGLEILAQSPCPWASGAIEIRDTYFPLQGQRFGSLCLDLTNSDAAPVPAVLSQQAHVMVLFEAFDRFSVGVPGIQIDNLLAGPSALSCGIAPP